MSAAISVRDDFEAEELRVLAGRVKDANQARRLLAIAAVYDGMDREEAARIGGIRAILVHAISEDAKRFYERYGFRESPIDPMTLMIQVAAAVRIIGRA